MDVIDRLHAAVRESGIPKKRVAHLAGISVFDLSRLLNHRLESPSIYDIEAVARVIGMPMQALYAEERATATEIVEARGALQTLTAFVDHHDASVARKSSSFAGKRKASRRARPFPVAATPNVDVYAGLEAPREDVPDDLWALGARHAAKVVGDSMIDAGIDSGDTVFFRPETNLAAAHGKIVVCRYGTSTYLKRFERVGDEIRLLSDNERYKPIVVRADEDFELYGVVVLRK